MLGTPEKPQMPHRPLSSRDTLIGGFRGRQDDHDRRRGAHTSPRSYIYARARARASGGDTPRAWSFYPSRGCAALTSDFATAGRCPRTTPDDDRERRRPQREAPTCRVGDAVEHHRLCQPLRHTRPGATRRARPGARGSTGAARRTWPDGLGPARVARRAWPGARSPARVARRVRPGNACVRPATRACSSHVVLCIKPRPGFRSCSVIYHEKIARAHRSSAALVNYE